LLADPGRTFNVERDQKNGLIVQLTGGQPDPIASVVLLKVKGKPHGVNRRAEAKPSSERVGDE
jgi:hypothetical protein